MKITLRHRATRRAARRAALLFFLGVIPAALAAQQPKMNMVKIADDVYTMVEAGGSSNSTFIITSDGVVVFDHYLTESDQTLAAMPSEFAHYTHPERLQATLPLYYWELSGVER